MFDELIKIIEEGDAEKLSAYCERAYAWMGDEYTAFALDLALEKDEDVSPLTIKITEPYSKLIQVLRQCSNPRII